MATYGSFSHAIPTLMSRLIKNHQVIKPFTWQSMDVSQRKEATLLERWGDSFEVVCLSDELQHYRDDIHPNLPWADNHFERDRVCGLPVNPGFTWQDWPWSNRANTFRTHGAQFDHSYAERFWPKYAGKTVDGAGGDELIIGGVETLTPNRGPRFPYGDLRDVVNLIDRDPTTRQAVLPIFFPEDTGATQGQRVPCSLFYHFYHHDGRLHMRYDIRSCDALRHFRDDIYLAVRLQLWVIKSLRLASPDRWKDLRMGRFTMNIGSFHCFINDVDHIKAAILEYPR